MVEKFLAMPECVGQEAVFPFKSRDMGGSELALSAFLLQIPSVQMGTAWQM